MKTIYFFILVLATLSIISCEPAKSDIMVEQVNPSLVAELIKKADSTLEIEANETLRTANPFFVTGQMLFGKEGGVTNLWYDELGNVTGMVIKKGDITTDSILFHQNGQRMMSLIFNKNGLAEGPARYYYLNGRVSQDGRFLNGYKNGIWRLFNENGKLEKTVEYDKYGNLK